jgi:K+-transporting ATPase KdpF subunit
VASVSACRQLAGEEMSLMDWIGLALCAGITVYLFIALLLPEKFE